MVQYTCQIPTDILKRGLKMQLRGQYKTPVLTFCNQKGGTGKTTLTQIATPYFAVVQQLRVLIIDCDPQCNLTLRYLKGRRNDDNSGYIPSPHPEKDNEDLAVLFQDKDYTSICDVFTYGGTVPYDTELENVKIIPADGSELGRINEVSESKKADVINGFKNFINALRESEDYDIILIDTPPNQYAVSQAAVYCSTDAFPVIVPESKSIEGLIDVLIMFDKVNMQKSRIVARDDNDKPLFSEDSTKMHDIDIVGETICRGIVINKYLYNARTVHDTVLEEAAKAEQFKDLLMTNKLAERVNLKLVDLHGANPNNPLNYPKSNPVYKECMAVFDEIWTKMKFPHGEARKKFDAESFKQLIQKNTKEVA